MSRRFPSPRDDQVLVVAREHAGCTVLGPGRRYVLWVQGCQLQCPDCISEHWRRRDGGRGVPIEEVVERIVASGRDGLTISGGEPFEQAGPLVTLIDSVRRHRDLSVMAYSGHTLEHLRTADEPGRRLLSRLDIFIDGPYVKGLHVDAAWRGSSNQRVHLLSGRHSPSEIPQAGVGLQLEITAAGDVLWHGVPPYPGFRQAWEGVYSRSIIELAEEARQ